MLHDLNTSEVVIPWGV